MNLRVLKSKEIRYPENLFMDIADCEVGKARLNGLLHAVSLLSVNEREMIRLRYSERMSLARLAQRLGKDRAFVLSEVSSVLERLKSPMMYNYIEYGIKKWSKIASLDTAARMQKISELEGKPVIELDISYLQLPVSVYSALKHSHIIHPPYTVADAVTIVSGAKQSSKISDSDREEIIKVLKSCGINVKSENRRRVTSRVWKTKKAYPMNIYGCIFADFCTDVDEDMQNGLELAISGLPEPGRQVIILRYKQGIPYKEVSEQLGLPLDMVRQHENRALRCLRRGEVRRLLRYGVQRSAAITELKNHPEKVHTKRLSKLVTASVYAELAKVGAITLADAKKIKTEELSPAAAFELNDILSYLGMKD